MAKSVLEKYCTNILDGKIVSCEKMKLLAEKMLREINDDSGQWHFDIKWANRPVEFIESYCKIPSGRLGKTLELEDYEVALIQAAFGFVDDNEFRRFIEVLVVWARKNGKSVMASALELYMLIADLEGAPQVYNIATSEKQAELCYQHCITMMRQSKEIAQVVRKQHDRLYCDSTMGYIKTLSSNTQHLDGLDVHFAVIDELAAIKNRDLYDLVKQGTSAREQPMLFTITTNGFIRNGIFDAQYAYAKGVLDGSIKDERFLPFIYELDSRDEWLDEKAWKKANPGLGTVKKESALRANVSKAKEDPTFLPTVLTKDFNVPENSSTAWLTLEHAVNEEIVDYSKMNFKYGIVGFDASDTIDLTAAQVMMMRPDDDKIYLRSMYWIPEEVIINDMENGRKERDGVPYQQWIARGLMRTVAGNKIDKGVLLDWLEELREEENIYTYAIGFDPWHIDDSTLRDLENFAGKQRCFKIRQGAQTLSQPMIQLKADYKANRIVDNHHPINEWCRMNVMIKTDANGNIQPYKKELNPQNRIDGFAAELDAYIVLMNLFDDYQAVC